MVGVGDRSRPGEQRLLSAARKGDAASFGELYRLYLADVRDFCARRISDPIRAEDLAQDTFIRAYEKITSFRRDAAFWPWLSTIARNLCIDELRQPRRVVEETVAQLPEPGREAKASVDVTAEKVVADQCRKGIDRVLAAALRNLNERERRLIWQHAVEELSWKQIALDDETTVDAVRNAAWRACKALRTTAGDSLRDLRIWVALPAGVAMRALRRLRSRIEVYCDGVCGVIFEHGASVLVGVIALSFAFLSGSDALLPREALTTPLFSRVTAAKAGAVPAKNHPPDRGFAPSTHIAAPVAQLSASIKTSAGGQRVIPESTRLGIELRGPNGEMIYWGETQIQCRDRMASNILPSSGPVRVVC